MDKLTMIGKFGIYIPDELWFDVATLKIDLRPALKHLEKVSKPKQPPTRDSSGRFVRVGV